MENLSKNLLSNMEQQMQVIAMESENLLQRAEKSFYLAEATVKELKNKVTLDNFRNEEQEIKFFKEIKPSFQKELIYYEELYHFEASKPIGTAKAMEGYFSQALKRIQAFFDKNRFLYNYYLSGSKKFDALYFLRNGLSLHVEPISTIDLNLDFSTPYSSRLAKLMAYEQLWDYLNRSKNNEEQSEPAATKEKSQIVWTDSKTAIMEVLVCIHASGSLNFGNCPLSRLVSAIEDFFNIKLDNYSQIVKNIRMRKKDRTPYMHNAIERGEKKMDQTDLDF